MALRTIRIGGNPDIIQYDDGDYDKSIEVDDPIKVNTAPVHDEDVLRKVDMPGIGEGVSSDANITDNVIVRGDGGARKVQGSLVLIDDAGKIYPLSAAIGGAVNYLDIDGSGILTLHGNARIGNDIYVSPSGIRAPLIKPASWVDHGISGAWSFDDGDDKTLVVNYRIPHRMDRSVAPKLHIKWSTAGADAGNCEWQVDYLYRSPDENTTAAAQDTKNIIVAASANANGLVSTDSPGLDLPSGIDTLLQVRLKRLAAGLNDTIVDTVELHGLVFHCTTYRLGEPI